jgi:hypothetical protein
MRLVPQPAVVAAFATIGLAAAASPAPRGPVTADDVARAAGSIASGAIRAHMAFLADDALEGRATATRGYAVAARYVATRFEALGLAPAGGSGAFLHPVALLRGTPRMRDAQLVLERGGRARTLRPESDFTFAPDWLDPRVQITAPLVFAGFGVSAPELDHDDYAGLDVRGKIVVALSGAPPRFPNDQRAYHGWSRLKEHTARTHGAAGLLAIRTPRDELRAPWERHVRQGRMPAYRWLQPDGTPAGVVPEMRAVGTLSRSGAEAAFAAAPIPLERVLALAESGAVRGFDLGARARVRRVTTIERAACANVAGRLEGSDPRLAREIVVVSAHLDHLGVGTPVDGDSIHNGALDNATGIAAMLEIARALSESPRRPRRSILFLAVTGEERGYVGSESFAAHPPVEGEIVANVNLDMLVALQPFRSVVAFGAEHSSLAANVERAARASGVTVVPDARPEEVVFVRSDQFSFVREGVPAVFPVDGADHTAWMRSIYHSPQDDMDQPGLDAGAVADFARFNLRLIADVANDPARPRWNDGDFFGDRFGRRR